MRIVILLGAALLFTACNSRQHNDKNLTEQVKVAGAAQTPGVQVQRRERQSDGSYERFMDSFLSKKDIVFSKTIVEAGEVWLWSDKWGSYPKKPKTFQVGHTNFLMREMEIVNEDDRLYDVRYRVDTAMDFSFRGKKYCYIEAHYYDCNGTGCMESYHLVCDYQFHRLHVFETFGVPYLATPYIGDFNNDGQLDFMAPECYCMSPSPYCDTTETIALIPYTLNRSGHFVQMKNDYKRDRFLVGQFDSGVFAPNHFRVIGDFW